MNAMNRTVVIMLSTPLIVLTIYYQTLPHQATKPNDPGVVHVSAPTNCYHSLPWGRSESTPPEHELYQHPAPGLVIEHMLGYNGEGGVVCQRGPGPTQWPTVGVVGIVKKLSTPSRRWHSDSENFLQGLRLVNEKTKSKFGKSNGGKITR